MRYKKLGSSHYQVSEICLGSMTWGQQNNEQEAHHQLDYAIEKGINFIDSAEMYPVPPKKETQGTTEKFIGTWLRENSDIRSDLVLATKITGSGLPWVRNAAAVDGAGVKQAIESSLQRLQTDYIDLYQIHWPNRVSPHFAKHWPDMVDATSFDVSKEREEMLDILTALGDCINQGKIKSIGLSNETPWGINEYLRISEQHNLPKIVSVQNEFSLIHHKDIPYMIESCVLNDVAYLPWSPLAGGALSGKYANGAKPEGSRWTIQQRNGIFRDTTQSHEAIAEFQAVADKHGLSLTQMSYAWVYGYSGVCSTIIGATSMQQLQENIAAYELTLSDEVMADINSAIRRFPVPF